MNYIGCYNEFVNRGIVQSFDDECKQLLAFSDCKDWKEPKYCFMVIFHDGMYVTRFFEYINNSVEIARIGLPENILPNVFAEMIVCAFCYINRSVMRVPKEVRKNAIYKAIVKSENIAKQAARYRN